MKRLPPRRGDPVDELLAELVLDERAGPALPIAAERALALARLAAERALPAPRGKLLRFPKLPLLGVGVVIATSAAAAALGGLPHLLDLASLRAAPTDVGEAPPTRATPAAPRKKPVAAAPAPRAVAEAPSLTEPSSSAAPIDDGVPPVREEPMAAARERHSEPRAMPALERHPTTTPAMPERATRGLARKRSSRLPAVERVAAPDSAPAADLLGVANLARGEGRFSAALEAYRRVIASFPSTRQAHVAAVSAGDLELQRGEPRAAEPLFYAAVRDADVGAEALFGLAEAYRAQGRMPEERRVLETFLERYPSNPLALAARQRLSPSAPIHAPH
jgi:TolA-binding protein